MAGAWGVETSSVRPSSPLLPETQFSITYCRTWQDTPLVLDLLKSKNLAQWKRQAARIASTDGLLKELTTFIIRQHHIRISFKARAIWCKPDCQKEAIEHQAMYQAK